MRIVIISLFFALFSCVQNNQEAETVSEEGKEAQLNKETIESLRFTEYVLDSKAAKEISSWQKYSELENLVGDVKNANLTFFKDNSEILKTFLEDLKSSVPEAINTPAVMARLQMVETFSYKLEDQLSLTQQNSEDLLAVVKEFLEAYSNLNFQINKKIEKDSQNIQRP